MQTLETDDTRGTELPPPGELMTVAEARRELGVSGMTVHRMIRDGMFRVYWPTPRRLWVFRKDVLAHKRASMKVAS